MERHVYSNINELGNAMASSILAFRAFTVCDTVSAFENYENRKVFATLLSFPAVIETFWKLINVPTTSGIASSVPLLEWFVVLMQGKSNTYKTTNETQGTFLSCKARAINIIPLTYATCKESFRPGRFCLRTIASPDLSSISIWIDWIWTSYMSYTLDSLMAIFSSLLKGVFRSDEVWRDVRTRMQRWM